MSPVEVRERADRIIVDLAAGGDPEAAHGEQDRFVHDVLRAIVQAVSGLDRDPWVRIMAEQGLRVIDAPGERWSA